MNSQVVRLGGGFALASFPRRASLIEPACRFCQFLRNIAQELRCAFFGLGRQVLFDKSPQLAELFIELASYFFKFVHVRYPAIPSFRPERSAKQTRSGRTLP